MGRIEEIRERESKATRGPWRVVDGRSFGVQSSDKNIASCFRRDNEVFIAHAREDIPFLLVEVERLNDVVKATHALIDFASREVIKVTAERDAAVRDIKALLACECVGDMCKLCAKNGRCGTGWCLPVWRGVEAALDGREGQG